jgi:hypothetical protein
MAKQSRETFQKRAKERARQQKQHDKVQRRLAAKERRGTGAPRDDDELEVVGLHPEPHTVPPQGDEARPRTETLVGPRESHGHDADALVCQIER